MASGRSLLQGEELWQRLFISLPSAPGAAPFDINDEHVRVPRHFPISLCDGGHRQMNRAMMGLEFAMRWALSGHAITSELYLQGSGVSFTLKNANRSHSGHSKVRPSARMVYPSFQHPAQNVPKNSLEAAAARDLRIAFCLHKCDGKNF